VEHVVLLGRQRPLSGTGIFGKLSGTDTITSGWQPARATRQAMTRARMVIVSDGKVVSG
jgi:hypothetical protein